MSDDHDATVMPAAFIGHGSPMNTLADNRYTTAWRNFGETLGRPRAVLVVSAHWYTNATAVTAMARPKTAGISYVVPQPRICETASAATMKVRGMFMRRLKGRLHVGGLFLLGRLWRGR